MTSDSCTLSTEPDRRPPHPSRRSPQRQPRFGVEVQSPAPCRASVRKPAAPIMAALSVDSEIGGTKTGRPARRPRASASARRWLLADTPPADADAPRAQPLRGFERPVEQHVHHHPLEAGADVRDLRRSQAGCGTFDVGRAAAPVDAGPLAHQPQHRGLQSAEAEVDPAGDVRRQQAVGGGERRVAIGMGQPGGRESRRRGRGPAAPGDRSPGHPDSPAPAASPPCRTPPPPHRRASGRSAGRRPARRSGTGWCGRPTRRGPPQAAAARRAQAPATRCARPGGGPE